MDHPGKPSRRPALSLRRFTLVCLLPLAILLGGPATQAQTAQTIPKEYELKAVYLYNFLQFINWPPNTCTNKEGRIETIGVIGESPIRESLLSLQEELRRTRGVDLSVRFYGPYIEGMDLAGCQLIFIAQPELPQIKKILGCLKGRPALLVADNEDCLERGCMIALLTQANKIRWAVNRRSVEASGLRVNARLLEMATKVLE